MIKKFMVVSDIHGKEQDVNACRAALDFAKAFSPDIRVIAGDLWNFAAIRKGAGKDEQAQSMKDDFVTGSLFADKFFGKRTINHLMLGNHDIRVWDMLRSPSATENEWAERMIEDIEGVAKRNTATLWPYDSRKGIVEIGHLKVLHGYHTGQSACVQHARIYGNCIFGHVHSIEAYQVPGLDQREARSIGCLCKLDQEYIDRKTAKLRWAHGWAFGYLFDDGTYMLNQVRGVNGVFYASPNLKKF